MASFEIRSNMNFTASSGRYQHAHWRRRLQIGPMPELRHLRLHLFEDERVLRMRRIDAGKMRQSRGRGPHLQVVVLFECLGCDCLPFKLLLSTTELNNSVEDYNSSRIGVVCPKFRVVISYDMTRFY